MYNHCPIKDTPLGVKIIYNTLYIKAMQQKQLFKFSNHQHAQLIKQSSIGLLKHVNCTIHNAPHESTAPSQILTFTRQSAWHIFGKTQMHI